jgi:hypothetical protein
MKDIATQIAHELAAGDSATLFSAEHFLTHCRVCGRQLSDKDDENLAVACKAGPLIFHLHCADQLRLTLSDHILYRSA